MVFFDNLSLQILCIDNVYIGLYPDSDTQRFSPSEFDISHFMFGSIIDLSTSPPTSLSATIWRRATTYMTTDITNNSHDFIAPPQAMLQFDIIAAVHRHRLITARQYSASTHDKFIYYLYDYVDNLLNSLEFVPECTRESMILADPMHGNLHVHLEAILPDQDFPPYGVNDWVMIQREEVLSGNEGGDVICVMVGPQPGANGPHMGPRGAP